MNPIADEPRRACRAAKPAATFTEHVISTAADGARSVFATDVDGDGDTDVLSASELVFDNKIAWCENTMSQVQVYADICLPYDPPNARQPDLDDILCELDDFADGPAVDGCTCNGFRNTTDLYPCTEDGGGNGVIGIDDIIRMLDPFAGRPRCLDPCPE